jgi:hypothetical protein
MTRTATALLLAVSGTALAQPVVLEIQPAQSSIDVEATLISIVGDRTDTASTSVSGSIEIVLDDYGNPSQISIADFVIVLDNDVTLNFSYGFLGSASATISDAMAMYGTPGFPTGPAPVSFNAFDFAAVPTVLAGSATADYSLLGVGSDTVVIDLADQGLIDAPISGSVTTDENFVTLSGAFAIDTTQVAVDGIADIRLVGTATLVAIGDAPQPGGCNPADLEPPFGVLDLMDIQTFVDAFVLGLPAADLAPPTGVYDLADLQAFVTAFLAGCP